MNAGRCEMCEEIVTERCSGGICRGCHKSCSWEDCTTGTYNAANMRRLGYPEDEIQAMYPDAIPGRNPPA